MYILNKHRLDMGILIGDDTLSRIDLFLIPVISDGKIGFINKKGEMVISPRFEDVRDSFISEDSLVRVKVSNGKWGVINSIGNFIIPFVYKQINKAGQYLYEVQIEEYNRSCGGLVDSNNQTIVPFGVYGNFYPVYEGGKFVIVKTIDLKMGILNERGTLVIPAIYDAMQFPGSSLPIVAAWRGNEIIKINLKELG